MTHPQVYPPQEDTYLLVEAALLEAQPGDRILEVGCGSGYIVARFPSDRVVLATDINPHAVRETREKGIEVVRADLLQGFRGPFDLILFNPPYLPTLADERMSDWLELALDGGEDGCMVIGRFATQVGSVLSPGGRILLLVSSLSGLDKVIGIFSALGFQSEIFLERRVEGETLSVIRCRSMLKS